MTVKKKVSAPRQMEAEIMSLRAELKTLSRRRVMWSNRFNVWAMEPGRLKKAVKLKMVRIDGPVAIILDPDLVYRQELNV